MDQSRRPPNAGSAGFLIVIAMLVALGLVISMIVFLLELGEDLAELPDPPEALLWCSPELVDDLKSVRGEFVYQSKAWVEINAVAHADLEADVRASESPPDFVCLAQPRAEAAWQPNSGQWIQLQPAIAQIETVETSQTVRIWVRKDSSQLAVAQSFVRWLRAFGDGVRDLRGPAHWSFPSADPWVAAPSWRISLPVEMAASWDARFHEFATLHGLEAQRALRRDQAAMAAFVADQPFGIVVGEGAQPHLANGLTPWAGGQFSEELDAWIRWDGAHPQTLLLEEFVRFLTEAGPSRAMAGNLAD